MFDSYPDDTPFCISKNTSEIFSNSSISSFFSLSDNEAQQTYESQTFRNGLLNETQCESAAIRFICQHYFPICASEEDLSLLKICRSSCDNYFEMCNSGELVSFKCDVRNNGGIDFKGTWNENDIICTGDASHQQLPFQLNYFIFLIFFIFTFIINFG
jgi:hypothetical protein